LQEEGLCLLGSDDSPVIPLMLYLPGMIAAFSREVGDRMRRFPAFSTLLFLSFILSLSLLLLLLVMTVVLALFSLLLLLLLLFVVALVVGLSAEPSMDSLPPSATAWLVPSPPSLHHRYLSTTPTITPPGSTHSPLLW
jgi:hypothetical protein